MITFFSRSVPRSRRSPSDKSQRRKSSAAPDIRRRCSAVETLEHRHLLTVTPMAAASVLELPDSLDIVSIATESNGNLVAYGQFRGTVDFDPGPGVTNLASSDNDLFVAKYHSDGNLIQAVDLSDGEERFAGNVAVDSDGNVYLSATYLGAVSLLGGTVIPAPAEGNDGTFVAKLDSSLQTLLWTSHGSSEDLSVTSLAIDGSDNYLYASGFAFGAGSFGNASFNTHGKFLGAVTKIDANTGEVRWLQTPDSGSISVAVDPEDTSALYLNAGRQVYRMDSAGNVVWEKTIDKFDPSGLNVILDGGIAASADGVFIAGSLYRTNEFDSFVLSPTGGDGLTDVFVARMDSATGAFTWVAQAGGYRHERANALTVDQAGSVFVAGQFEDVATFGNDTLVARTELDRFVSQLNAADGAFIQSWRYGRATVSAAAATSGNLYVAGRHNAANIDFPSGDLPQATSGVFEHTMRFVTAADPGVPRINGLLALPPVAELDELLSLDIVGMHDPDGRVNSVTFYHDVDADRRLDPAIDLLLDADTDGTDGWGVDITTSSLPLGIVLVLAQTTYDGNVTSLAVSEEVFHRNPSTEHVSTDVGQSIRDLKTVQSNVTVPESFVISDVDVSVNITHTFNGDLDVFLTHPDGTRVELFTDLSSADGTGGTGLTDTVLDDQADYDITSWHASNQPITGRFRPGGLLEVLNGKDAQGIWTLEITDDERKDTGTLDGWSLTLAPDSLPAPSFTVDDVSIIERDSGTATAVFTVTRSGDPTQQVSVDYATVDGTATSGSDYVGVATTTVTFAPGVVSLPVSVTITGDADAESDETFFVNLTNAVGGTISDAQGVGTILDDDSPIVTSALFVYEIRFDSKRGGKDHRAVVEIRTDSDGDGQGTSNDDPVAGVEVRLTFAGTTYTGTTDSNGVFRTPWVRNTPAGDHYANAVDVALAGYIWDPLLDLEDDSDGDGKPDGVVTI